MVDWTVESGLWTPSGPSTGAPHNAETLLRLAWILLGLGGLWMWPGLMGQNLACRLKLGSKDVSQNVQKNYHTNTSSKPEWLTELGSTRTGTLTDLDRSKLQIGKNLVLMVKPGKTNQNP